VQIKCSRAGKASPGAGAENQPRPSTRTAPRRSSRFGASSQPGTTTRPSISAAEFVVAKLKARAEAQAAAEKNAADEQTKKNADIAARDAHMVKARAAEAAERSNQLKQLSAQLKAVQERQDKLAAQAKELAKKENSKEVLENNAKSRAELAKMGDAIRKQIAAIQQSMLRSTATTQPK